MKVFKSIKVKLIELQKQMIINLIKYNKILKIIKILNNKNHKKI